MKKIYFILLGLFFLSSANAQLNCKAIQGYAYCITTIPGNLQVDENGVTLPVRLNKQRFIYFITSCKTIPTINRVLYGRTNVKTDLHPTLEASFSAVKKTDQENINLNPRKGTYLWKLDVIQNLSKFIADKNNTVTVTGKIGTKTFFLIIREETELQGHDTY